MFIRPFEEVCYDFQEVLLFLVSLNQTCRYLIEPQRDCTVYFLPCAGKRRLLGLSGTLCVANIFLRGSQTFLCVILGSILQKMRCFYACESSNIFLVALNLLEKSCYIFRQLKSSHVVSQSSCAFNVEVLCLTCRNVKDNYLPSR